MVPLHYNYRNLGVRWKTTLMTAGAFTLVVAAIVVMLAFVSGVQQVCVNTGHRENVLVLGQSGKDEVTSTLTNTDAIRLTYLPGVVRGVDGAPLASRELYMNISQVDPSGLAYLQQVRGVTPTAFRVHPQVSLSKGRRPRRGQREVMIGAGLAGGKQLGLGDSVEIGSHAWTIVGVFRAAGSAFESEVWADLQDLSTYFRREGNYSSVVLRLPSESAAKAIVDRLGDERGLKVNAQTEADYYSKIAEDAEFLRMASMVIAAFMGIGAVFGITNTMFAAIGQRVKDIAVLRILGYTRSAVLRSFLFEAVLIGVIGGLLGVAVGYGMNGLSLSAMMASRSVAFAFTVDDRAVAAGVAFTMVMSFFGGLLPALSAMRVDPLESLR